MGCGVILAIADTKEQIDLQKIPPIHRAKKEIVQSQAKAVQNVKGTQKQQLKAQIVSPTPVKTELIKVNGKDVQEKKNNQQFLKKKQEQKKGNENVLNNQVENKQSIGKSVIIKQKIPVVQQKSFQKKQTVGLDTKKNVTTIKVLQNSTKEGQIDVKKSRVVIGQNEKKNQNNSLSIKRVPTTNQIKNEKSQIALQSPREKINIEQKAPEKKTQSLKSPRIQTQRSKKQNDAKKVQMNKSPRGQNQKNKQENVQKKVQEKKSQIIKSPRQQKDKQQTFTKQLQKSQIQEQKKEDKKRELKKDSSKRQNEKKTTKKTSGLTPSQEKRNKQREEISRKIYGPPPGYNQMGKLISSTKLQKVNSSLNQSNLNLKATTNSNKQEQVPTGKQKNQPQTNNVKAKKKEVLNNKSFENINTKQKSQQNSVINKNTLEVPPMSKQVSKQNSKKMETVSISNDEPDNSNNQNSNRSKKSKDATKTMIPVESLFCDSDLIKNNIGQNKQIKTKNNLSNNKKDEIKKDKDNIKENESIKRTSRQLIKDGSGEGKKKAGIKIQQNAPVLEHVSLNNLSEGIPLRNSIEIDKQKGIKTEKSEMVDKKQDDTRLVLPKS